VLCGSSTFHELSMNVQVVCHRLIVGEKNRKRRMPKPPAS
jgi:hypothetical protein